MTQRAWQRIEDELSARPRTWLVTGAAGFIGSHLVESLLALEQNVVGLDNFAAGHRANLDDVRSRAGAAAERLRFMEADIVDPASCRSAMEGVDVVLHQAALGSVPRSIEEPLAFHRANVDGFVNMLEAARTGGIRRFVYASSSSVYGDRPELPKREEAIGEPLSPYAATKRIDEIYAETYGRNYGMDVVGFRYFNVFGPRQDPAGAYAAVIPCWIDTLMRGEAPHVNGDGETTRDFCPVRNVVQANLLGALADAEGCGSAYNVAMGQRTSLNELFRILRDELARLGVACGELEPQYGPERAGDIRHSLADLERVRAGLGFDPDVSVADGLRTTVEWFAGRSPAGLSATRGGTSSR